jgi:DNA-directed RNA polymerase specialized sigma24 family protein
MDATGQDFGEWYSANHGRLVAGLLVISGRLELSRDAVDEACVRAYTRWERVSVMESPTGWVYRVALNVLRRQTRRAALEQRLLRRHRVPFLVDGPAGEAWELVAGLPPRQRTAIVLRYVSDLTQAEIANAMGVSRSTVSSTLANALARLGEVMAVEPVDLEPRDA